MKPRHLAQAWILLSIIVSMQIINAFHIHIPQVIVENVVCDLCEHHMHHSGHFINDQYHMHPCLSCQISSNEYLALGTTQLIHAQQQVSIIECPSLLILPVASPILRQPRAPPVI